VYERGWELTGLVDLPDDEDAEAEPWVFGPPSVADPPEVVVSTTASSTATAALPAANHHSRN
jgi:hypothetical protein